MIKQTLIACAAVVLAATPALASYHSHCSGSGSCGGSYEKTVKVNKAHVDNSAVVTNVVFTAANSGLNGTSTYGGDAKSGKAWKGGESGDAKTGSTSSSVTTGDAGAASVVENTVNTTVVSF